MNEQNRLDASIRPFEVFINHRGPDVKGTLASNIYYCLCEKGLAVFFDKREFQPGQELPSTIREAIRTASVHIAILSPRYAESPWCLDELCEMQESVRQKCGVKIIPVFYKVPPEDLMRLQKGKGKYAEAFSQLGAKVDGKKIIRFSQEKLDEWKEALKKISNVSGLDFEKYNGDEGELVQSIVSRVMEHCRIVRKKPDDALNYAIEDFEYELSEFRKKDKDVRTVGIVGTAGSGKTTLAEEYYYRQLTRCDRSRRFDRSSFLFGVRNASERNGLQTLQSQLLKDLTGFEAKINNIIEGKEMLEKRVASLIQQKPSIKFLIVIDDVGNRDQLDALLLKGGLLRPGSLVIVTSCDKSILKLSRISLHYKMKPLVMEDARKLLRREAFHQDEPITGFEDLEETALKKCGGLPLFLKHIGGHLHLYGNNNKEDCERELEIISDIADILKVSYAALGEEEKQIFLDIACFFEGMEKNSAIRIWDGFGWNGARAIQKLEYMCLVEIDQNNQLKMEGFLSKLGREIADQQLWDCPDLPCRLLRPNQATDFLEGRLPLPEHIKIRGITDGTRSNYRHFRRKRFIAHTISAVTIDLLDVHGDLADDILSDRLIDLVWFRWKNCPRISIPLLEMNNLRVLELVKGKFTALWDWDPSFELPTRLREVRVKKCNELVAISSRIGSLRQLEKMTLNGSIKLANLPPEFCRLQALTHLELRQCESLILLPADFGDLKNLQHVDFSGCQNLSELPHSFGQLSQLRYLDLQNCRIVEIQPEMFREITILEQLSFQNCENLRQLPTQITCQRSLHKLNLLGTSLEGLPDNIDQLEKLQLLYIGSPLLTSIPASLGNLLCLSELVLFKCTQMICYPEFQHLACSYAPHLQTAEEKTEDLKTLHVYGTCISDSNVRNYLGVTSTFNEPGASKRSDGESVLRNRTLILGCIFLLCSFFMLRFLSTFYGSSRLEAVFLWLFNSLLNEA